MTPSANATVHVLAILTIVVKKTLAAIDLSHAQKFKPRPILTLIDLEYIVIDMTSELNLGEFEQIVLLAILRLNVDAYGVSIRAEISQRTGREPSSGALYTTLDRLEQKGLLKSRTGEPTPRRGGRAKRYYKLTASGAAALTRAQLAFRNMLAGLTLPGDSHA